MPECNCFRHCNGGTTVSKSIHNRHAPFREPDVLAADKRKKEREKLYASAVELADEAINQQDRLVEAELAGGRFSPGAPPSETDVKSQHELEALEAALADMILTGESTGPPAIPGGRLWSADSGGGPLVPLPPAPLPVVPSPPSKQQIEAEHLHTLATLRTRLTNIREVVNSLSHQLVPKSRNDPFPIQSDVDVLYSIWHSLERTWPQESKRTQKARLDLAGSAVVIIEDLKPRQSSWRKAADQFPEATRLVDGVEVYDASKRFDTVLEAYDPTLQLCLLLVVALQVMNHASRRSGQLTLGMLSLVLKTMLGWPRTTLSEGHQRFINALPSHPDTVKKKFDLQTQHTIYAVCPNLDCHKLYKPSFKPGSEVPIYPKRCDHQEYPDSPPCGTILTNPISIAGKVYHKPIKRFVAFDLKDWMSRLLSQPGREDQMDNAWSRTSSPLMHDVFDGDFLQSFKYKDGKPFSHPGPKNQARYALSMSVDFFNPRHNSSHSVSCGIISLVNLNLPPEDRYKAENVFLAGIIPGPKEPSVDAMNRYFVPIVSDLKTFWDPGVYMSRTAKYADGRLVILALVLLICDLPAARKTAGVAGIKHNQFCSVCHVTLDQDGYESTDYFNWKRRTNAEYHDATKKYLVAKTEEERTTVFNQYAVRWSAFTDLEYFDMRTSLAIDAMHNLFLGMLREHSNILGIGVARSKNRAENVLSPILSYDPPSHFDKNQRDDFAALQMYLQQSLKSAITETPDKVHKKLASFRHPSLRFMAEQLGSTTFAISSEKSSASMTKDELAHLLFEWRKLQREWPHRELRRVLETEELERLGQIISTIIKPTWLTSLPSSLGTAVKVKLKADQWRVFGTVYLPLTLVTLWMIQDPTTVSSTNEPRSQRIRDILDATFNLVQAILIATSGTMSETLAKLYVSLMLAYMDCIKKLFPEYKFKPNNHMSLHLAEHLQQFGPVHSWWTFPFERVIGMIQRIPTNNILGLLEETMAFSFHSSSNLKNLFRSSSCPPVYAHASPIFDRLYGSRTNDLAITGILKGASLFGRDVQDADQSDDDHMDVDDPEDAVTDKLSSANAELLALYTQFFVAHYGSSATKIGEVSLFRTLTKGGVRYSARSHHLGNSLVNFSSGSANPQTIHWGQIEHFLSSSNTKDILVVIRRFNFADGTTNPFQTYPFLRGQLLLPLTNSDSLETIATQQIISHFACVQVKANSGEDVMPAISLSRRFDLTN